jgi:hypothetical protein
VDVQHLLQVGGTSVHICQLQDVAAQQHAAVMLLLARAQCAYGLHGRGVYRRSSSCVMLVRLCTGSC